MKYSEELAVYDEDELLPISALQHLAFCARQWGLIHLEGVWAENRLTVKGQQLHQKTDVYATESRGSVRIAMGLRLRSLRLGLTGKADVVEFHCLREDEKALLPNDGSKKKGIRLQKVPGLWFPVPVEYKRGRPKPSRCDEVQLCAQALCLEEMMNVKIDSGFLFYGRPRRRYEVLIDDALRKEMKGLSSRLHYLTRQGKTPPASYGKKCTNCSLLNLCLPKATSGRRSTKKYLADAINSALAE